MARAPRLVEGTLMSAEQPLTEEESERTRAWLHTASLPLVGEVPLPVALRPDCVTCSKKLKPNIAVKYERFSEGRIGSYASHRYFEGYYGLNRDQFFCSNTCAARFGHMAARAGYRRVGG